MRPLMWRAVGVFKAKVREQGVKLKGVQLFLLQDTSGDYTPWASSVKRWPLQ